MTDELTMHPYHCPIDGTQLHEIALGLVACRMCDRQFIPTSDLEWQRQHGGQEMLSLTWIEDRP